MIQAGAIGGRGRILVLDMGEPVRILDLAENMIRLSGKEPGRDVEIRIIGVRPGEKLHEELFAEGETWQATTHPKILALDVHPVDREWLDGELDALERLVEEGDTLRLVSRLREIVLHPHEAAAPVASESPVVRVRSSPPAIRAPVPGTGCRRSRPVPGPSMSDRSVQVPGTRHVPQDVPVARSRRRYARSVR